MNSQEEDLQIVTFWGNVRVQLEDENIASTWHLFVDKFILEQIRKSTIVEAHSQTKNDEFSVTKEQVLVVVAIVYDKKWQD